MVNDEIIGGLISALSREETLENAMMTFYNAGYKKEEIEDSAKEVYSQLGPQLMGIKGSLQETLDQIASKAGVPVTKDKSAEETKDNFQEQDKLELQTSGEKKTPEPTTQPKPEDKNKQDLSLYNPPMGNYQNSEDITNRIEEALKDFKPVNIPSRIEIVHTNRDNPSKTVVQHVSDYSAPKPVSKAMTYVLIGILIILLIALGGVFLFKDQLIELFNKLGIA